MVADFIVQQQLFLVCAVGKESLFLTIGVDSDLVDHVQGRDRVLVQIGTEERN